MPCYVLLVRGLIRDLGARMDDVLYGDLIYVFAFCLGGLGFALGPFVVVHLLAARKTRNYAQKTEQFIECGMEPIGDAWIRYSAVYYLYALVFVAFAVDVLYLVPVALVYKERLKDFFVQDFAELLLFVGILSLVIVYAWKKGVFDWKRRSARVTASVSVPSSAKPQVHAPELAVHDA
jgi:NADH:ubiquinone oxidoreductase subunit 3 (subunit A)